MTAVSYLRRSSASQSADTEVSFDAQRTAITALAASRGETIATEYSDYAKSGGSTNGRHGYHDMLTAIANGQVTTVYAYAITRLTRNQRDALDLWDLCKAHGVVIRTADGIDTSSTAGMMLFDLLALTAKWEREWATERTRAAMSSRKARGDAFGNVPLGFKSERDANGARVLVPTGEAQVVIDAYKAVGNVEGAARKLTVDGVLTPRERARKAKAEAKGETYTPTAGLVWRSSVVAEILDRNAPELLPPKRPAGQRRVGNHLLSQLVLCHCGRMMTPSKQGHPHLYCSNGKTAGANHGQYNLSNSKLLPAIEAEAAKYLPDAVRTVVRTSDDKRKALLDRRERINVMFEAGGISDTQYRERVKQVDAELDALASSDRAVQSLRLLPAGVDFTLPEAEVNEVLRTLWSAVRLDKDYKVAGFDWRLDERYYSESARDAHDLAQDAEVAAAQKAGA